MFVDRTLNESRGRREGESSAVRWWLDQSLPGRIETPNSAIRAWPHNRKQERREGHTVLYSVRRLVRYPAYPSIFGFVVLLLFTIAKQRAFAWKTDPLAHGLDRPVASSLE